MQVRSVRLLGMDDPVELDAAERKRIRNAEDQVRYRKRHPERVKAQNAANYKKNREKRLAEKKAARYGPGRRAFLARAREANRRSREKNLERARSHARARYARNRVKIIMALRAERRSGNIEHFSKLSHKVIKRNQIAAIRMNAMRGARVFAPVPVEG